MLHLIYGGTFDPVHHGHLAIARAARDLMQCPVWLMPAADPPHRPPPGASADERLRMLELALAGEPGLHVERRELERPGPSYTVETLRELRAELGVQRPLALLLGADSFLGLPGWHDWRVLFRLAHLLIAGRCGSDLKRALPAALAQATHGRWADTPHALHHTPAGCVLHLGQPLHPASATDVRRRLAGNLPCTDLLPTAVAHHIREHGLYRKKPSSLA